MMRQSHPLLDQILFGLIGPYKVAGMGEPWKAHLEETLAHLREQGIGAILTLTEDDLLGPGYLSNGFLHLHEPIDDYEAPTDGAVERSLAFLDDCLARDIGVAVHCLEGRGRTGTIICAWLARKESLAGEDAIRRVRSLRPVTALSPSQKAFLLACLG